MNKKMNFRAATYIYVKKITNSKNIPLIMVGMNLRILSSFLNDTGCILLGN